MYFPDRALASTILLSERRDGGPILPEEEDLGGFLHMPSYVNSIPGRTACLSFGRIAHSRYSKAITDWGFRDNYETLSGMKMKLKAFVEDENTWRSVCVLAGI